MCLGQGGVRPPLTIPPWVSIHPRITRGKPARPKCRASNRSSQCLNGPSVIFQHALHLGAEPLRPAPKGLSSQNTTSTACPRKIMGMGMNGKKKERASGEVELCEGVEDELSMGSAPHCSLPLPLSNCCRVCGAVKQLCRNVCGSVSHLIPWG